MKVRGGMVGLLLALAGGCGDGAGAAKSTDGSRLFVNQACATCHGMDGAGSQLGPPLQGQKKFWTREKLVRYLRDPIGFAEKDPRLGEQSKKYMLPMARFDKLTEEELGQIADFVLAM
jgi:mono/diheme cytochrome c family protein